MRIFITGGSRGIGRAMAEHFANLGHKVAICSRNPVTLNKILTLTGDVADYNACQAMFAQIFADFGGIDVLVNNAAIAHTGYFADMPPAAWKNLVNINLGGVINCSHIAINQMLSQGKGQIINISSIWGNMGASCEAVYSATKGGVNAFTKALARELGPANIRINAIACGVVNTEMNSNLSPPEKNALTGQIPLGRFANPQEIAVTAEFLMNNNYVTGQIITIDGGLT